MGRRQVFLDCRSCPGPAKPCTASGRARHLVDVTPQLDSIRTLETTGRLLRLHTRLSLGQRQTLRSGKPLPIAQLAPALRPLVLATPHRIARNAAGAMDLEPRSRGQLSLAGQPDVRIREKRGRTVTWRLESASAPRGTHTPDAVARFRVTQLRTEIHYGPALPVAVTLIVAADAAPPE